VREGRELVATGIASIASIATWRACPSMGVPAEFVDMRFTSP
jgi:hypothetical protein